MLPILFTMIFAIFSFGRGYSIYTTMIRAAQESARLALSPVSVSHIAANVPASRGTTTAAGQFPPDTFVVQAPAEILTPANLDPGQTSQLTFTVNGAARRAQAWGAVTSRNGTKLYISLRRRCWSLPSSPARVVSRKVAMRVKTLPLPKESGVTLLIVAVSMFALLAMAMIALDVVNLYVSSDQAQRSADAAALAGAEAFVTSSTRSTPFAVPLVSICNGSTGDADLRAQTVAAQNTIAGSPPDTVTTSCPTAPDHNRRIQVTVTRVGIPNFLARIWGSGATSVSANATAEAYNPSFDSGNPSSTPISIHRVKPWGIANCNTCAGGTAIFHIDLCNRKRGRFHRAIVYLDAHGFLNFTECTASKHGTVLCTRFASTVVLSG